MTSQLRWLFVLAFLSHAFGAWYSFAVKGITVALGGMHTAVYIYVTSAVTLVIVIAGASLSRTPIWAHFMRGLRVLLFDDTGLRFKLTIVFYLLAGVCYYRGIAISDSARFAGMVQLAWILQVPVGILILREAYSIISAVVGVGVAFAGAFLIWWKGGLSGQPLLYAAGYVVFQVAAYSYVTTLFASKKHQVTPLVLLFIRTWSFVPLMFIGLLLSGEDSPQQQPGLINILWITFVGGILLVAFHFRFVVLQAKQLWWLSAFAPVQAAVIIGLGALYSSRLTTIEMLAIVMISAGECVVGWSTRKPELLNRTFKRTLTEATA